MIVRLLLEIKNRKLNKSARPYTKLYTCAAQYFHVYHIMLYVSFAIGMGPNMSKLNQEKCASLSYVPLEHSHKSVLQYTMLHVCAAKPFAL